MYQKNVLSFLHENWVVSWGTVQVGGVGGKTPTPLLPEGFMTQETAEKQAIKEYLRLKKVFFYHNLAGLGVYPGIPDLSAIKNGHVYQIEVKVKSGRMSEAQRLFKRTWEEYGGTYICGDLKEVMKIIK